MTQNTLSPIPDRHQNFWQLASIQGASQSIPGILIGEQLAREHGTWTSITSICIGNLILWIIGLAIISMAARGRNNAIENVKKHLGVGSSILTSLILMIAFLTWYMLEIKASTTALAGLFQHPIDWQIDIKIRLGAVFGILIALLSVGGIRLIKWVCVASLPLLLIFVIFTMMSSTHLVTFNGLGFSFLGTITVAALTLPGTINLPTFFRHSKSKADSYLALTLITGIDIFFQLSSIWIGIGEPGEIFSCTSSPTDSRIYVVLAVAFIVLSLICLNLVNIYFASAGWETILPHRWSPREYAIVGLLGTAAYTFFQTSSSMLYLESIVNNFITSLGIVLLTVLMINPMLKYKLGLFEKIARSICWFIGCVAGFIVRSSHGPTQALIAGISASLVVSLFLVFFEQTRWAIKKIWRTSKLF